MAFVDGIKKFFSISHSPIGRRVLGLIGGSSSLWGKEWDFLEEANRSSRIQSPIHIMASDVAMNEWYLTQRNKERDFVPHVPTLASSAEMLEEFWEDPCPKIPRFAMMYWTQGCFESIGRCYWRLKGFDQFGRPTEAWPLPPHWIQEEPCISNGGVFKTHWWDTEGDIIDIPAGEVWEMLRPSWQEPLSGAVGMAQSLDDEIAQDKAMARFNTMYFENFACLGAIMGVPGYEDDPDAVEDKVRKARVGAQNAFKTLIFDSAHGNVSASNLSPSLKDLNFAEGRTSIRDSILHAWQILSARAGTLQNTTRQDIEAADFHHSKYNILPRLEWFSQEYDRKITALFDDRNMLIPYRTRKRIGRLRMQYVNPVRKTNEDLLKETTEGVRSAWMKRNEARVRHGLKPDPKNGDVYIIMKNNLAFMPADADITNFIFANDPNNDANNDAKDPEEETDDEDRAENDDNEGSEEDT